MSDFNRVILMGRIGNDLELKASAQGKPYLKLSIATHSYKSGGDKATYWHRVVVFGQQAEICAKYLRKGSSVLVEGSLEVRTYNTGEEKRTIVSVLANRVQFLGGRQSVEVVPDSEVTDVVGVSEESPGVEEYSAVSA